MVGSKLVYPNATIQHAGIAFAASAAPIHLYAGFPEDHPAVNKSRRFQAVSGACMLVRRGPFEALGGFERAYRNLFEDVDLCLRLGERGHEIHYCHTSEVVHLEAMTRHSVQRFVDAAPDPTLDNTHSVGLYRLRWMGRVVSDHWRYYEDDGLLSIRRSHPYPLRVAFSPQVVVLDDERERQADHLLDQRAGQVYALLQENTRLAARVKDLELHVMADRSANGSALPTTWTELRTGAGLFDIRAYVANLYLKGVGIEIGALSAPLPVPPGSRVQYVDRLPAAELRKQYPELNALPLVDLDIIDDGERLESIAECSQDFVIANHFIEHCQDPIGTIQALLRVTKPGGVVYLAIPDKRFTFFDVERPVTQLQHLLRDNVEGPEWSQRQHFEEWAEFVNKVRDKDAIGREADRLVETNYSIHYHVWTQAELSELFASLQVRLDFLFDVELMLRNGNEILFVLRKNPLPER